MNHYNKYTEKVINNTIVIYHQLNKGGGLFLVNRIAKELQKKGFQVINLKPKEFSSNNIFSFLFYIFVSLPIENYLISKKINNINPSTTLIFPSSYTQAPSLLLFTKKLKYLYFFLESKREFYECTSFDHNNLKNIITRIVLLPVQINDIFLTKLSKNIITISSYSQYVLSRTYRKRTSFIVKPGQKDIKPNKIIQNNKNKTTFLSIGLLTKHKGHHFTFSQLHLSNNLRNNLVIIGHNSHESDLVKKISRKFKNIIIKANFSNSEKDSLLRQSTLYFANQENEPYGISTLEATNYQIPVLGKNLGGTPEIIKHGINGLLYTSNLKMATINLNYYLEKNIEYYQTCIIDWKYTVDNLLKIISSL